MHLILSVIFDQDSNISQSKLDMLTYINDIIRISPVTWAVLKLFEFDNVLKCKNHLHDFI